MGERHELFVEKRLPDEFFSILGRYIATCAYVEEAIYLIILNSDTRPDGLHNSLEMKRNTTSMLKQLEATGQSMSGATAEAVLRLHARITDGLINRHHAVHGVWRFEDGYFFVNYNHREGKKEPNWVHWPGARSYEDLRFALEDANDILEEADKLIASIPKLKST